MATILLYGDTVRYPALRHEVPLAIIDPLLLAVRDDGATSILTSSLEAARIADARPDAELVLLDELGFYELLADGTPRDEAELETVLRAVRRWGIERALVPPDLPVAVADTLRGAGVGIDVDARAVEARRRAKTAAELEGIRRAQHAAERGMDAGRALIKGATAEGGLLQHDGGPLTAEAVREAVRAECAAAGAPAPPDIMVVSLFAGGGHDPGSGPLPAGLPIEIDLWPCDEASGCWADMTRTFVGAGEVTEEVAKLAGIAREALEAARSAARPGVTGRALYDAACDVVERASPTAPAGRRARRPSG